MNMQRSAKEIAKLAAEHSIDIAGVSNSHVDSCVVNRTIITRGVVGIIAVSSLIVSAAGKFPSAAPVGPTEPKVRQPDSFHLPVVD